MEGPEAARERPLQPLVSLGNDSYFLDAILGEILQPQHNAPTRGREWGRRRASMVPSAPPLEVDDYFEELRTPDLSPIPAASPQPASSPDLPQDTDNEPEASPTSARLLELVTSLADTLPPPSPDPCEMTRCDSWEFSSLRVKGEPRPTCDSPSTCSSFESLSRVLDGLSSRGACRASMFVPRAPLVFVPDRPRSASPTLPLSHHVDVHETRECRDECIQVPDPQHEPHQSQ